jgi:hypothetical protein
LSNLGTAKIAHDGFDSGSYKTILCSEHENAVINQPKRKYCDWRLRTHDIDEKRLFDWVELCCIQQRTSLAGEICDSNRVFSWDGCTDHQYASVIPGDIRRSGSPSQSFPSLLTIPVTCPMLSTLMNTQKRFKFCQGKGITPEIPLPLEEPGI